MYTCRIEYYTGEIVKRHRKVWNGQKEINDEAKGNNAVREWSNDYGQMSF